MVSNGEALIHNVEAQNRVMAIQDEIQLVESAKTDTNAFGMIYDHYFPKVYAFVAAKVSSKNDAEDLVSEVFMKILENICDFEDRGLPFGAWVFRIARNALNDFYKKNAKVRTSDIEEAYGVKEDEEKTSPQKAALNELSDAVKMVLRDLDEKELLVIQLKFFAQLNNREITQVTGLSESNVGVILYRTLKKMRPELTYFE